MNQEIWQQLLSLETKDIIQQWFHRIHDRELNARRTREINTAAKQSREYFRNANNANYSVRPLLTFYGVASLSRALLLLLKRDGGEERLASGHGIRTINWSDQLSGETSIGLRALANLKVQTCSGLFSDFVRVTQNRLSLHVRSSEVDWRLNYDIPEEGVQLSLGDILARLPDLSKDYSNVSTDIRYASINEMSFNQQDGFKAKIAHEYFENFQSTFQNFGYSVEKQNKFFILTCDAEIFEKHTPLFVHTYIHKMFGTIPSL